MPEPGTSKTNPDHDLLMQIKTLQEVSNKELIQAQSQLNKDIFNLTMQCKDTRAELRDDLCKLDMRVSVTEKRDAVYETCFDTIKANNLVKKEDLKELAAERKVQFIDVYTTMRKEDDETREELRRSIVTMGTVAGIIGAVGGSILGIIIGLWIG